MHFSAPLDPLLSPVIASAASVREPFGDVVSIPATSTSAHLQVALSNQSPYVKSAHRVSGLMLANHTSIRLLIEKCLRGFRKLFPKFYVDHYKDFKLFNDGEGNLILDEFHDAAHVVQDLCDEYKACESDDYITSTSGSGAAASASGAGAPVVEQYSDARVRQRSVEGAR
jgi:Tubulin C-terminal domain